MPGSQSVVGQQEFTLSVVEMPVFARMIAIPAIEESSPHDSYAAEYLEGMPPRGQPEHQVNQRRGERASPARAKPHDTLGAHALMMRKPDGKGLGQIGKATRLAHAEQEAGDGKRGEVPGPSGGGSEKRPPQHNAQQDAPRAQPIAQETAGNLKHRISEGKSREGIAHLHFGQTEVRLHQASRQGDAHAVDISDDGERNGKHHHPIADAGGLLARADGRGYLNGHEWGHHTTIAGANATTM